jgi:hypothetical protein
MRRFVTARLILLVALLVSLIRVVIGHSAHLGPAEWLIVTLVAVALGVTMFRTARRPA